MNFIYWWQIKLIVVSANSCQAADAIDGVFSLDFPSIGEMGSKKTGTYLFS